MKSLLLIITLLISWNAVAVEKTWFCTPEYNAGLYYEDEAEDVAGQWIFWDEAGNKVHEREYNEIELSVMLTIMDEWKWNKLRADGCSKELLDKFGEYIFY